MSTVLVIDDSDMWCDAVELELGKHGYTVLRARHQDEAMSAAMEEQPTLVVIDVLLAARRRRGLCPQATQIFQEV